MSEETKNRTPLLLGIAAALVALGAGAAFLLKGADKPARKPAATTVINVTVPPPPPPPLPPPPPRPEPPPEEQKMVEAEPVVEDTPPEETPAPEEPPAELTTNLGGGDGNDFGLKQGSGKGSFGSGGRQTLGGKGSKWGSYNAGLQQSIRAALKRHPLTAKARFNGNRAVIWIDSTGRIQRAKLLDPTRQPGVDDAIVNEVLPGLIYQPQPEGMPQGIQFRIRN